MRRQTGCKLKSLFVALICICCSLSVCFSDDNDHETASVLREARSYFEAELSRDAKMVWMALAPSSVFKRQYSHDDYLEMYSKSDLSVKEYSVLEVIEIINNNDRKALPDVEKLAAVKVRVKLTSKDGKDSEHNNIFIFLKENGKWFKG